MNDLCIFLIFLFKNHFWPQIVFLLLRWIWLPWVHCILLLFMHKLFSGLIYSISTKKLPKYGILVLFNLSLIKSFDLKTHFSSLIISDQLVYFRWSVITQYVFVLKSSSLISICFTAFPVDFNVLACFVVDV